MTASAGVLFDADGTLVDTTYLHVLAWWRALEEVGERRPMAAIHRLIGMGSDQLLPQLLGRDSPEVSEAHGRHYAAFHAEVRPLPGAVELLDRVRSAGARVVLATSAKSRDLEAVLDALDGRRHIDQVVAAGEVEASKPAPHIFSEAVRQGGIDPSEALAVGDTVWDVQAAGRAGLPCLAVQTGGQDEAELTAAGAVAVYRDCAALLDAWEDSPVAALLRSGGAALRRVGA